MSRQSNELSTNAFAPDANELPTLYGLPQEIAYCG